MTLHNSRQYFFQPTLTPASSSQRPAQPCCASSTLVKKPLQLGLTPETLCSPEYRRCVAKWNADWERARRDSGEIQRLEGVTRSPIAIIREVLFTFRDKDFDGKWLRADPASAALPELGLGHPARVPREVEPRRRGEAMLPDHVGHPDRTHMYFLGLQVLRIPLAKTADWKNHKGICGKPFDFDTVHKIAPPAAAAAAQVNPVVGPAIAGFSRSTALSYLLLSLAHRPADYLIMPGLETESLIDFIDAEAKSFFRAFRDKAFTAGDREATAVMAHAICWWACLERYGGPVTLDIMADQIQLEFSFDSVKVAVLDMEGRQIRDPHKRPVGDHRRSSSTPNVSRIWIPNTIVSLRTFWPQPKSWIANVITKSRFWVEQRSESGVPQAHQLIRRHHSPEELLYWEHIPPPRAPKA
ncbi:hypothetical protein DFH09DRAFT_1286267 [Mycena vulgaris]|nr:hypothetical protein DFH09DRAFT_1286267 [Mycena vulgaris]